jgi:hypothetical protein
MPVLLPLKYSRRHNVAPDAGYLSQETFETLYRLAEETKALSGGLVSSVRRRSSKSRRR